MSAGERREGNAPDVSTRKASSSPPNQPPDAVSRRALLKASFSTAVVTLFFNAGCGGKDPSDLDEQCANSCQYASDGDCDDGGTGSSYSLCSYGTDCADCGTRYGYGNSYSNSYSDYSDSYSDYSNSYSDYSNSYSNYSNSSYSNSYYNYSNYTTYYNYFSNSW